MDDVIPTSILKKRPESDMAGDRVTQERTPRGRVEKVWRTVRWAESFPEEALNMDTVDLTPTFAIRKIASLFDRKKFADCAALVRRLNGISVAAILTEVPVENLHNALPASLPILEALYVKVHRNSEHEFPTGQLMTDQLVKRLVTVFATQTLNDSGEKNSNVFLPYCRTIIRIIMSVESNFREIVLQRKKAIDRCLRNMGKHGMVDSSGGKLMTLHDALKVEFEKVVIQYKCALQKLDELCLSAKHPVSTSVSSGPAPSEASHQRMMQVHRADVQDRIIKNKTLYNLVEPAVSGQYLRKLISILERRIDYDKVLLFHDTELRKMSEGVANTDAFLSQTLRHFSQGYGVLLRIISDITGESVREGDDDVSSDGEDDVLPMTSTLSIMERMKVISLNGIIPINGVRKWNDPGGGRGQLINLVGSNNNANGSHGMDRDGSIVPSTRQHPVGIGGISSQRDEIPAVSSSVNTFSSHNSVKQISAPIPMGMEVTSGGASPNQSVALLEQEIRYLRDELAQSRDQIRKLQDQEKQLRERLEGQVYAQFTSKPSQVFEDLSLGSQRPTSLIRAYDDLYREGRVDTLDALDSIPELRGLDILKMKILFSVVVLAFRCVQQSLFELKGKLRHLLCLPVSPESQQAANTTSTDMENSINNYLTKTVQYYDISPIVHEVCQNIYATLYDYPGLKNCAGLAEYTKTIVRLAWGLSVQNPPYVIVYDSKKFQTQCHVRFHTSDSDSDEVKSFLWPILVDGHSGQCVAKGMVIT